MQGLFAPSGSRTWTIGRPSPTVHSAQSHTGKQPCLCFSRAMYAESDLQSYLSWANRNRTALFAISVHTHHPRLRLRPGKYNISRLR